MFINCTSLREISIIFTEANINYAYFSHSYMIIGDNEKIFISYGCTALDTLSIVINSSKNPVLRTDKYLYFFDPVDTLTLGNINQYCSVVLEDMDDNMTIVVKDNTNNITGIPDTATIEYILN